jgi:hypothetical protein
MCENLMLVIICEFHSFYAHGYLRTILLFLLHQCHLGHIDLLVFAMTTRRVSLSPLPTSRLPLKIHGILQFHLLRPILHILELVGVCLATNGLFIVVYYVGRRLRRRLRPCSYRLHFVLCFYKGHGLVLLSDVFRDDFSRNDARAMFCGTF